MLAIAVVPLYDWSSRIGRFASRFDSSIARTCSILQEQEGFRVRDLGSTNGTFLNGEPIQESRLSDGDILTIADTEFTFFCGEDRPSTGMVTQVMSEVEGSNGCPRAVRELILGVRRLHEPSLHRAMAGDLRQIVTLHDGMTFGWSMNSFSSDRGRLPGETLAIVADSSSPLASSLRQRARVAALSELTKRQSVGHFLLSIGTTELEDLALLRSHLARLRDDVPESAALVAVLPGTTTYTATQIQKLCSVLGELGMRLAFESTLPKSKQLLEYADARPAFAVLTARAFREISGRRPARSQLAATLAALGDIGCQPIADGLSEEDDSHVLRDLGFQLALRNTDLPEPDSSAAVETNSSQVQNEPTETVQSTLAEIAKVTARIRASWSNR